MKTNIYTDGKYIEITARFGEKMGYSPYFVTSSWSPNKKEDIMDFFCASTTEAAIKYTAQKFLPQIQLGDRIALITGDGQVIDLTIEKEKKGTTPKP